jgi:hypothetical protein
MHTATAAGNFLLTETIWYVLVLFRCYDKTNILMCTVRNHILLDHYDVTNVRKALRASG